MNKLSIALLSIACCIQQTQSMQLGTPSNNDEGYTIITKDISKLPKPTPIYKQFDALSEKLYDKDITDTQIRELVRQGAKVNYQRPGNNGPVIFIFACNSSQQGIKNMQTMRELGAPIHNIEDQQHTPLTIALERDYFLNEKKNDFSGMIQFLIPYEDPIVTIYTKTEDRDGKPFTWITYSQEQKIREYLISHSFCYPNIATIKLLLDRKLVTPNRALKEFARLMKPNQEVLNLLLKYGANNGGDVLPKVMQETFPSNQYIELLRQLCESGAFNEEVRNRMLTIKKDFDAIVVALENHQPK